MNTWILQRETSDKKGFEFLNAIRDHEPLILEPVQIRNFDAPDKLVLYGQIIFKDSSVHFEPFHPKPASPSTPSSSLRLFIENADKDGIIEQHGPTIDVLRFWVSNSGSQAVRDYRVMILVPPTLVRYNFLYGAVSSFIQRNEIMVEERGLYTLNELPMSQPIYKDDSIKIGEIMFSTTVGDHTLLWQIRSEEGVFPADTSYGELKVRIVPTRR
ncbi:MAG: hypothetical protein ABI980_06845 [Nitrospirota bacterium]